MFRDDDNCHTESERRAEKAPALADSWSHALRRLRAQLGEDVYTSWFSRLELVGAEHGTLNLSAPTRFLKSWIQAHYADRILAEAGRDRRELKRVAITVRGAAIRGSDKASPHRPPPPETAQRRDNDRARDATPAHARPIGSDATAGAQPGLDPRYTFANFAVGDSNLLAHAAARKVASATQPLPNCNPLYIHAGVGLGKTHLLLAVANEAARLGRRVQYLTADAFMHGFASSVRSQSALTFKDRIRSIDVLLTDDVQFLQGKTLQQEFCHTINALIEAGKTVVVAADRPPGELESLDERVRSRLKGGLVVDIEPHDEELRRQILTNRIEAARALNPGFEVAADVIAHIARRITANGRDLEGAVNRLVAQASLTGAPATIETAEVAIRDLVGNREPRRPKIEEIQKLVAGHFNVSRADILSSRRTANVVRPRQIAMYLAKMLTPRSLPEIGRRFGGRDHTTVLHAVRKVGGLVEKDNDLRDVVDSFKRMLTE